MPPAAGGPRGSLLASVLPADGIGELYVQTGWSLVKLATFRGPPWHTSGRAPVAWQWDYDLRRGRYTLMLVAAPTAAVERTDILTLNLPEDLVPEVVIVRAQDVDLVPEQGTRFRPSDIVGRAYWLVNGYSESDEDGGEATSEPIDQAGSGGWRDYVQTFTLAPDFFKASVEPRPNGVTIRHALNHWRVDVLAPWNDPASYAFEIVMPTGFDPYGGTINYLLGAGNFHIRVVHSANVTVEGQTLVSYVGEELSNLRLESCVVEAATVPAQGTDLSHGAFAWKPCELKRRLSPQTIRLGSAVEFAVGFIPVVGSLVSVGHVLYMASTGETLWGEQVTQDQLVLEGVFALLGGIGDTKEAAEVLSRVAKRLHPGRQIVSLNPGLATDLKQIIDEACDTNLLEGMRRAAPEQVDRALTTLDEVVAGSRPLSELVAVIDDVLYRATVDVATSGALPESLVVRSLEGIHPAQFDDFPALPLPRQRVIIDAYNAVVDGQQPSSYLISYLEPSGLGGEFASRLDEWRAGRVLNTFFTGFRSKTLQAKFANYRGSYNAIQWAVSKVRGAVADELTLTMGSDFRSVLRALDPEQLWQVSDKALAHYLAHANRLEFYIDLRKANQGHGLLFEIDHGVEHRFFRNMPFLERYQLAYEHVQAILVPKNPAVAANLPKQAVNYVHSVKTAMMASLIPHGGEGVYTLQAVLDAHTLVYVHWLKVPLEIYVPLIHNVFTDMANVIPVRLDLSIPTEGQLLSRNPTFRSWSVPANRP